ncbi:MAG: hypothetical protein ACQESR_11630 [Planctomycetota bacterium]
MESCPTQAVLPLVGLVAEKVIRDRYVLSRRGDYSRWRVMVHAHERGRRSGGGGSRPGVACKELVSGLRLGVSGHSARIAGRADSKHAEELAQKSPLVNDRTARRMPGSRIWSRVGHDVYAAFWMPLAWK